MLYAAYALYNERWLNVASFIPALRGKGHLDNSYIWDEGCYTGHLGLGCLFERVLDWDVNLQGCVIVPLIETGRPEPEPPFLPDFTNSFMYDWSMMEEHQKTWQPDPRS